MNENSPWRQPPPQIAESEIIITYDSDVVIVGAGHSGVAAARACAENGLSVRIIELMNEKNYWAYGIDYGHINSVFLRSQGIPEVDELEFFNDWQLRNGNRSNPRLVMKFVKNSGECFDWFYDALSPEQQKCVQVRFSPPASKYAGSLNGIKTWVGTATFPEALWHNRGITEAVLANIERAKQAGAQFHFLTAAKYLEQEDGRVVSVIAEERHNGPVRFRAKKAVVLAAGDFAHNEEMMQELCVEQATLAPKGAKISSMLGRDGSGIRMGLWAGGRMVPGPLACMGGNNLELNSPLGVAATLWLNSDLQRYCNEGFGGSEFAQLETARQKYGPMYTLFDGKYPDLMDRQPPCHGQIWFNNPEDPFVVSAKTLLDGALKAGKEGFSVPDPHFPKMPGPTLYAADTLEDLADYLGIENREAFLSSVARYNELCAGGRDEDFGKDPSLMVSLDQPPFFGMRTDHSARSRLGLLVTLDGLWTDDDQQVLNEELEPIPGLYATGNCCGRRFGVQYSTPISGISIGIAWTLGRELGKYLGQI